jgi:putative transposase
MCRLYGVTTGGFYAWCKRKPSERRQSDAELLVPIREEFKRSRDTYGSPRIRDALQHRGINVGAKRVARLMRDQRIQARSAYLYRRRPGQRRFFTSIPNVTLDVAPPTQPNQLWVGDVTYLQLGGQWRYLAVIMDRFSRRIVGRAISRRRDVALTSKALERALRARQPPPGLIFHSDRGMEYAGLAYRKRIRRHGIVQSMNRPRWMNDNAHMESFFHSMKSDVYHGHRFTEEKALQGMVKNYIPFYNEHRIHTSLGSRSPVQFEQQCAI